MIASNETMPRRLDFVLRSPGNRASLKFSRRAVIVRCVLVFVIAGCSLLALSLGTFTVSLADIVAALTGTADDTVRMVVVEWRLPRVLIAAVFGAALGLSGALFQSLTRNALGSPDVIGFSMGSFSGVLIVMMLGGTGFLLTGAGALGGGLVTALLVYVLAFKQGIQGFRLIIIGIALSAMLASLNTWIMVKVDLDLAMQAAVWGAGTLNGVSWSQAWPSLMAMIFVAAALVFAAPRIRHLELGDETAAIHGLSVERTKIVTIVLGIAFTALVTATAGPIAFIALAAPQLARRLTRTSASIDLATSALVGAALLGCADLIAQHAIPNVSLPVGAVSVSIGGLYLVWLLARETKTR